MVGSVAQGRRELRSNRYSEERLGVQGPRKRSGTILVWGNWGYG